MATVFCHHSGDDTTETSWATASSTLALAITAAGNDGLVYVSSNHVDPTTGVTLAGPTGVGTPCTVISVNSNTENASDVLGYLRGATCAQSTTGADIVFSGQCRYFGVDFSQDDNITWNANSHFWAHDCTFTSLTPESVDLWTAAANDKITHFDNCTFDAGAATQGFNLGGGSQLWLRNCTYSSSASTIFIETVATRGSSVRLDGMDFSACAAGFDILGTSALPTSLADGNASTFTFSNCLLPDGTATVSADTFLEHGARIEAYNVTDGTADNAIYVEDYRGLAIDERTTVRNATDDGSTKYSLKITGTAESTRGQHPFRVLLAEYWAAAAKTHTVHFVTNGALTFDVADLWVEFVARDGTNPAKGILASSADTAAANAYGLNTPGALTTDAAGATEWTDEPASSNFYEISHDYSTTDEAGPHEVWVCFAPGAVEAVFCDPAIEVSA